MPRELKNKLLSTRVTNSMKSQFIKKAKDFGNPGDILRELVHAFIEDRLIIQPPENNPLYNKEDS